MVGDGYTYDKANMMNTGDIEEWILNDCNKYFEHFMRIQYCNNTELLKAFGAWPSSKTPTTRPRREARPK